MTKYSGKTFTDQAVTLDGNSFENCTFDGCVITYGGGDVSILGAMHLINENRVEMVGAAQRTWAVLSYLSKGMGVDLARLAPFGKD